MEILGIGPSELVFIVLLALIILGPRDMQKAGQTLGRWLRQVVTSDGWKFFQQTSREIQTLPNRLMREAALEELRETDQSIRGPLQNAATMPSGSGAVPHSAAVEAPKGVPGSGDEPAAPAISSNTDPEKDA